MRVSTRSPRSRPSGRRKRAPTLPRAATRLNIIETAERLFGLYGIHGVSLRQIGLAAGSANKNAIPYHFKNLNGLVRAIFEHRLPALEARRREMLAAATAGGATPGVRALLAILYAPLTEQANRRGIHSYAAFLAGLSRFQQLFERGRLARLAPVTAQTAQLLSQRLPHLSPDQFWRRRAAIADLVLSTITRPEDDAEKVSLDDLLDMAAAALQAPCKGQERRVQLK